MAKENRNVCRYCANVFTISKKEHYCTKKPITNCKIKLDNPACKKFTSNNGVRKG